MKKATNKPTKKYIIKDTLTNKKTGEVLVYFTGVDGYVHSENDFYFCEGYTYKKSALNRIAKDSHFLNNEPINELEYIEGGIWWHKCEILEISRTSESEEAESEKDTQAEQEKKNKEDLEFVKKALEEICSNTTLDFLGDYGLEDIDYLGDTFHEFSDNNISVYCSDQFKYYEEHPTECEDALLELYDGESIAQKIKDEGLYNLCCFAGVCGQYEKQLQELYTNEAEIKKLLVVRYLLKNDIFIFNLEQLTDLLEQAENDRINEGEELLEIIHNAERELIENIEE